MWNAKSAREEENKRRKHRQNSGPELKTNVQRTTNYCISKCLLLKARLNFWSIKEVKTRRGKNHCTISTWSYCQYKPTAPPSAANCSSLRAVSSLPKAFRRGRRAHFYWRGSRALCARSPYFVRVHSTCISCAFVAVRSCAFDCPKLMALFPA